MSDLAQRTLAHSLVDQFGKRSTNVTWFNVQRDQIAKDLDERIDNPFAISQNNTEWCGYASILYQAASKQPANYATFVISLFETGRGNLSVPGVIPGVPIEEPDSVRFGAPPTFLDTQGKLTSRMPQADYVALGALRNHFKTFAASVAEKIPILNLLDDIHGSGGGELCNALKKLGCQNTYDQSGVVPARELGYLNAASGHFDQGHIVILLIDDSLLDRSKPNSGRGNHWVSLASPVTYSADGKTVSFDVFSWGKKYSVTNETTYVVQIRFFGYVVGY